MWLRIDIEITIDPDIDINSDLFFLYFIKIFSLLAVNIWVLSHYFLLDFHSPMSPEVASGPEKTPIIPLSDKYLEIVKII